MAVLPSVLPSVRNLRAVLQSVIFVPFAYAVFFNMIPTFLTAWENANRIDDRFQDSFSSRQNMYDFIIVGGGSAGSVIANRLSETYTVLLIEAGGPANPLQLVPALSLSMVNQAQTDWSYKTVPQQRACLNSISQECTISAGRSLGGSSTLGWMSWLRGHPSDFDNWAMISGDRSWSYEELLPFFKRSEEFIGTSNDPTSRGLDGELRIRQADYVGLGQEFLRAGEELGWTTVDLNAQHAEGFSILQAPIRRGMRQSTAQAFLNPIRMSPKLRILQHALVTRILFRDMSNMAYGVEYERFGRTDLAIANREVVLAAGSFGSPKLLMLSGVGPRAHLEQMGIPVRSDLPVGRNLQDHLAVQLGPFYVNSSKTFLRDRDINPENIARWIIQGRGPLSTTGVQGAAVISSTAARARGERNWPDILLLMQAQAVHREYAKDFSRSLGLQEDEMMRYYENAVGRDSFHVQVVGARPTATGQVLLSSPNPRDPIIINPRFLEDNGQADIRILAEGILSALRLIEGTSIFNRTVGAIFTRMKLPGCESHSFRSMAYWDCYIRRFTHSIHNPVGTASMGAVVDADLKVRGTKGLRVIDASIMPTIISVPTLATTILIAEKGCDIIIREYSPKTNNTGRGIIDFVFGRNGIINRNPIQRFLSREFDRLNPLPSLFSIPANNSGFNPFSRFLGIFRLGQNSENDQSGGILGSVFSTLNRQTTVLFATLLGGRNGTTTVNPFGSIGSLFGGLFPSGGNGTQLPRRPPLISINSILNSFGGIPGGNVTGGGGFSPPPGGNFNGGVNNGSNLFDIIFPQRNNSGTVTLPVNPPGGGGGNIFGNLFGGGGAGGNVTGSRQRIQFPNPLNDLFNLLAGGRGSNGTRLIQLPNPLNDFVKGFKPPSTSKPSQGPPNRNIFDSLLNPFGNDKGRQNNRPLNGLLPVAGNDLTEGKEDRLGVQGQGPTERPRDLSTIVIPLIGSASSEVPTPATRSTTVLTTALTTTTVRPTTTIRLTTTTTTTRATTTTRPTTTTTTTTTTRPTTTTTKITTTTTRPTTTTTRATTTTTRPTTRATTTTTRPTTTTTSATTTTTRPTTTTTQATISSVPLSIITVPILSSTPSSTGIATPLPKYGVPEKLAPISTNLVASATTTNEDGSVGEFIPNPNILLPVGLRGRRLRKKSPNPNLPSDSDDNQNRVINKELAKFRSLQSQPKPKASYHHPPVHFRPSHLPFYAQYDDMTEFDPRGRSRRKEKEYVGEYESLDDNQHQQQYPHSNQMQYDY